MKSPTLRGQLTRAALLTIGLALLMSAGGLLGFEFVRYRHTLVEDIAAQAELVAHTSEAALEFDDAKTARESLASLRQVPRIRFAMVLRPDGTGLAVYSADTPSPTFDRKLANEGGHRFVGSSLLFAHPVMHLGERVGTVYMVAKHDVASRIASYAAIEAFTMSVSLALALLVFGRLQRSVTEPLLMTTAVADKVVSERDWRLRAPSSLNPDVNLLVSAFNRLLDEVQATTEELKQADRRKDEFLAMLAHELRNPLAPMTNAVSLMRLAPQNPAVAPRALDILDRQLKHLARLIDDLMDVARITTGKLVLNGEQIDLVRLVAETAEAQKPLAGAAGLSFEVELPDVTVHVIGDSARLAQILGNLLSNAFRYTPSGGLVQLTLDVDAGLARIRVTDTGIGMSASVQQRVFELFEQGDKRLERGNSGLGIGLTLARQLARLHDGEISAHSEGEGSGSVFTVCLPLAAPSADSQAPVPLLVPSVNLRVLIADDNVDAAESNATLLEMEGYEVKVVHDGQAALNAALAIPFDVAVLDIGMPQINGYDLARQLRANPATAHVGLVAVTGWGQPADRMAAFEAGFDQHLVKPAAIAEMLRAIAACAKPVPQQESR